MPKKIKTTKCFSHLWFQYRCIPRCKRNAKLQPRFPCRAEGSPVICANTTEGDSVVCINLLCYGSFTKYFFLNHRATFTSIMRTGTSTKGPMTAANAAPELI